MKLINESSRPTEEVRRLVRIGMQGMPHQGVTVRVVDARKGYTTGRASDWDNDIVLRIPHDEHFPSEGWKRHGYVLSQHDNWKEALVAVAAHEAKHHDLFRSGRHYRMTGQQREMACDAHARWVLDRYRASC